MSKKPNNYSSSVCGFVARDYDVHKSPVRHFIDCIVGCLVFAHRNNLGLTGVQKEN
jgi:hypothetical protein